MAADAPSAEHPAHIIVGVDGSSRGTTALTFALDEAVRCGDSVELVTAWTIDIEGAGLFPVYAPPADPSGDPEQDAKTIQADAIATVLKGASSPVPLTCTVRRGDPGHVLAEASKHARLLVVGSRGLGPIRAAVLGSVSRYSAHHAACPVVVVPSPDHPKGDAPQVDLAVTTT